MATIEIEACEMFHATLAAAGPAREIPRASDIYGWLVGDWELEVLRYWGVDVAAQEIQGEVHAEWILEGRAIQDVWIMPRCSERTGELEKDRNMYGTTLRVYDPTMDAWRITWINPAGEHYEEQIGRRSGRDIVQIGARPDGTPTRWTFAEIRPDSFHWLGESLLPDGHTWKLEGEFLARRMSE